MWGEEMRLVGLSCVQKVIFLFGKLVGYVKLSYICNAYKTLHRPYGRASITNT